MKIHQLNWKLLNNSIRTLYKVREEVRCTGSLSPECREELAMARQDLDNILNRETYENKLRKVLNIAESMPVSPQLVDNYLSMKGIKKKE